MAKKKEIIGAPPPCTIVKIGDTTSRKATKADGCLVISSAGVGVGKFAERPGTRFTSQNVRSGRGEKCGTTTVKSGKDKGKVKPKACAKPCGLIKKGGVTRCPVQLAYDQGQPFLRFCTTKNKQGYRVDVSSPEDALRKAQEICARWEKKRRKFEFTKTHPLGER